MESQCVNSHGHMLSYWLVNKGFCFGRFESKRFAIEDLACHYFMRRIVGRHPEFRFASIYFGTFWIPNECWNFKPLQAEPKKKHIFCCLWSMSGFKQLVGSGGIGAASKNNFPPKIRPHRFGGEGVLIGGQQQH